MFDPISELNEEDRTVNFVINEKDYKFPEFSWVELVDCAVNCLLIVKYFLDEYRQSKELAANEQMQPTS